MCLKWLDFDARKEPARRERAPSFVVPVDFLPL